MNRFEIFSLVWLVFAVAVVAGVGFYLVRRDERAERRKAR
jgi:hypothetical protein